MIYLYFSDEEFTAIQTTKSFLRPEKIVASARKQLKEGIVKNGNIEDTALFTSELNSLLLNAYPKPIKEKEMSVVIPDENTYTKRIPLKGSKTEDEIAICITQELKKLLPQGIDNYINFYRTIPAKVDSEEAFYTGALKSHIAGIAGVLTAAGYKLKFLSTKSLALFQVLKPILTDKENIVYAEINNNYLEVYVLDESGPLYIAKEKVSPKTIGEKIKKTISQICKEQDIAINKVVIGGFGSVELHQEIAAELKDISLIKINDLIEEILKLNKLFLETSGLPKFMFSSVLGLFFLSKSVSPPNFAEGNDLPAANTKKAMLVVEEKIEETKTEVVIAKEEKPETAEKPVKEEEVKKEPEVSSSVLPPETLFVEKKSGPVSFLSKKLLMFSSFTVIGCLLIFGIYFSLSNSKSLSLPFISPAPTMTPTPTIMPTATPTPTIDPSLKRTGVKVTVKNGTDKTGYAKEIAALLEEKGYKNVGKGNADKDTYENTILKIKKAKSQYEPLIKNDLSLKFPNLTVEELDSEDSYDVVIILGKQ